MACSVGQPALERLLAVTAVCGLVANVEAGKDERVDVDVAHFVAAYALLRISSPVIRRTARHERIGCGRGKLRRSGIGPACLSLAEWGNHRVMAGWDPVSIVSDVPSFDKRSQASLSGPGPFCPLMQKQLVTEAS